MTISAASMLYQVFEICSGRSSIRDIVSPASIPSDEAETIVCVTSDGYLLAFPLAELPELSKGKGNKRVRIALS